MTSDAMPTGTDTSGNSASIELDFVANVSDVTSASCAAFAVACSCASPFPQRDVAHDLMQAAAKNANRSDWRNWRYASCTKQC